MTPDALRPWLTTLLAVAVAGFGIARGEMAWIALAAGIMGVPGFAKGLSGEES